MDSIKTIGVCGFGWTGSGAVIDLLKEYEENEVIDGVEFNISYLPDGLQDLQYHLMVDCSRFYSSDIAIKRFIKLVDQVEKRGNRNGFFKATHGQFCTLSRDYISQVIELVWKGNWSIDLIHASSLMFFLKYMVFERFFKKGSKFHELIEQDMYYSVCPERFIECSRTYISNLLDSMGYTFKKNIVLDQPFPANNPTKSFEFFENPKAIIVDRDPRDLYLLIKNSVHTGCIPTNNVDTFIKYYRLSHKNFESLSTNILKIHFEDLVYNYDETVKKIEMFCDISNHHRIKRFFNPDISVHNTQLYRKIHGCEKDIKEIENALPEYLYIPKSNNFKVDVNHRIF